MKTNIYYLKMVKKMVQAPKWKFLANIATINFGLDSLLMLRNFEEQMKHVN